METTTTASAPTKLMLTCIPFEGFYDSYASELVDQALGLSDGDYDMWIEDNPKGKSETDDSYRDRREAYFEKLRDEADYKGMQIEFCKEYVEEFSKDNGIKLEFESLDSPKFYNFTTDRIFCFIHPDEVSRLVKIVDRKALAELIKEKFTSRDGFSSHYASTFEEWKIDDIENLDHNMIETIIECVTAPHIAEKEKNYPYIAELMDGFYR